MRKKILELLQENKSISGMDIAGRLGVTRSAVWKHIKKLREDGYQIDSSTRLGYSLRDKADILISEAVTAGLTTSILGKDVIYYESVSSTQNVAEELARKGAQEGTVVIAEYQSEGRGRKGRLWLSPFRNGIYMSIILRPQIKPVNAIQIPLVAGISVAKAISATTGLPARIKWPNDININKRKVAGILTEIRCELDGIKYIILGIGINVNTRIEDLQFEDNIATSLAKELGFSVSRLELTQYILRELERIYLQFIKTGVKDLLDDWVKLSDTIGEEVVISDLDNSFTGRAVGLDDDGFLLVRSTDGEIHRIISGDVSLRSVK